ncbi:MAG: hypothetical protein BGN88_01605 [Clostridiales bacterium 43-6]|nr:MAG: hypothetical protein BGN88_01605 [Clostridiales bacterium 43-6]
MKNQKKKKKLILLLVLLLICILFSSIAFILSQNTNKQPYITSLQESTSSSEKSLDDNGAADNGAAKTKTADEIRKELQKKQVSVADKLSSSMSFENGEKGTVGSWTVENVKTNNVIVQAEVYLDNKIIAKTVPIYPDQHISTITLLNDIAKGQYKVTAYLNYYNLTTKKFVGKAGFNISLTIN